MMTLMRLLLKEMGSYSHILGEAGYRTLRELADVLTAVLTSLEGDDLKTLGMSWPNVVNDLGAALCQVGQSTRKVLCDLLSTLLWSEKRLAARAGDGRAEPLLVDTSAVAEASWAVRASGCEGQSGERSAESAVGLLVCLLCLCGLCEDGARVDALLDSRTARSGRLRQRADQPHHRPGTAGMGDRLEVLDPPAARPLHINSGRLPFQGSRLWRRL
jgi:hypothetical protein